MKRTPLKRSKPLRHYRREGADVEREQKPMAAALPSIRPLVRGTYTGGTTGVPVPKENSVRSEAYRRLVAQLPCIFCGVVGYSQAAHPNAGKGGALKTDDRLCFPLCTVHPVGGEFVRGCHERFDQGALFPKEARRELEPAWALQTSHAIRSAGLWPKNLPALEV